MASDEIRARLAACPSGPPTIHQALDYVAHYARDVQALLDRIAELEAGLREVEALIKSDPTMESPNWHFRTARGAEVTKVCAAVKAALAGDETGAEK